MPSLGTAYVAIKADRKALKPGLKKARATVASSVKKMDAAISSLTFRALQVSAVAFSAAMVYNFKLAIDAASDLQEVTSKFETVFKGQTVVAEKWTKGLVDGYAMSTREAKQYLSSVQDLLVPMGMQAQAAGRMSNEIVKLSADLGSFNNLPTAQVMNDIQSALVGNYETMKKYGVVLNATVTQQKALEMGLAETKQELTAGMKAQAAYALMVEGSQAAIGDMARTMEGYANQLKQLTANLENIRAEIGDNLLPIITPYIKSLNEWTKANKDLIGTEFKEWLEAATPAFKLFAGLAWMSAQAFAGLGVSIQIGKDTFGIGGGLAPSPDMMLGRPPEGGAFGGDNTAADEVQQEQLERSLEIDQEAKARYLELELTHQDTLLQMREGFQSNMAVINEKAASNQLMVAQKTASMEKQIANAKLNLAMAVGNAMLNFSGANAKQIFLIQKTTQVGMAIMAAFLASNMALATFPGPPYTVPLAAATLKLGLFNAGVIAATAIGQMAAMGGGGGGMASVGGGTYVSPIVTTPQDTALLADSDAANETRGSLNIYIDQMIGDESYIDYLVEMINEADDRDVFINHARSAREIES